MGERRQKIPAVEAVLQALGPTRLPRVVVTTLIRRHLADLRSCEMIPELPAILARIRESIAISERGRLQPVINGAGILIHTNLGRAPICPEAIQTLASIAGAYNNLEFDLNEGDRGGRAAYLEGNLALLCGAEAATIVNNCAAALVLAVRHFTRRRTEVVISRGELVQIGGGFRVPEILQASGARLREVGATNKTLLQDYAQALGPDTALILKVHRSNFYMGGFVESPSTSEIAALARKKRIPFLEDLGSGAVIATERFGFEHEPTPAETLKQGVDLVTFSGDKLLGGPQAGIIAGKAKLISALKREPFLRALRCDKLILAALQTTIDVYLHGQGEHSIPILVMLNTPLEELRKRGTKIIDRLRTLPLMVGLGESSARMGGGTLPRSSLPSVTLELIPHAHSLTELETRLRHGSPPVIGYIANQRLKLDLRTVFPSQDEVLAEAILRAATPATES